MPVLQEAYNNLIREAKQHHATLVAVSKTKPVEDIRNLYNLGHRDFGENYVQELVEKQPQLPADINWHFIGHLQTNKVKYIAPFVYMIHGVDSFKLLKEINKQGARHSRKINCLLQIHVATEETKFGMDEQELMQLLSSLHAAERLEFVEICGIMAMASFSDDMDKVKKEFQTAKRIFEQCKQEYFASVETFSQLSMGMSGDYRLALTEGSTIIRIGSLIFGER